MLLLQQKEVDQEQAPGMPPTASMAALVTSMFIMRLTLSLCWTQYR